MLRLVQTQKVETEGRRQWPALPRRRELTAGRILDITPWTAKAGIHFPAAISRELFERYIFPDPVLDTETAPGNWRTMEARLWETVHSLCEAIAAYDGDSNRLEFGVLYLINGRRQFAELSSVCGPDEDGQRHIIVKLGERA